MNRKGSWRLSMVQAVSAFVALCFIGLLAVAPPAFGASSQKSAKLSAAAEKKVGESSKPMPLEGKALNLLNYKNKRANAAHQLTESANVEQIGRWLSAPIKGVALDTARSLAFVARGDDVDVVDVSTPASPVKVSSFTVDLTVNGLFYLSNMLYIAAGDQGLVIYDVTTPASPVLAGALDTGGYAMAVFVSSTYAYVADADEGLLIVDVSNPAAPVPTGIFTTPATAVDVFASGSYLYLVDSFTLHIMDVTNPAIPFEVGSFTEGGELSVVEVSGSYAYLASLNDSLWIVDVSHPEAPVLVGDLHTTGHAYSVALAGDYALVARGTSGLQIIYVKNPASPILDTSFSTTGSALDVVVSGSYAYLPDTGAGLRILDISKLVPPTREVGHLDMSQEQSDVAVSGSYAYLAATGHGLKVVDVSNPELPVQVGTRLGYDCFSVAVSGNHLYGGGRDNDRNYCLQVYDITNPAAPSLVGSWGGSYGDLVSMAVSGSYVYAASRYNRFYVIDVSNPASPTLVGSYSAETGTYFGKLDISGNYVYLTAYSYDPDAGMLYVVDVSNPESPAKVASITITPDSDRIYDVALSGNYAFVGTCYEGLMVVDVSNPVEPFVAGSLGLSHSLAALTVSGSHLFIGSSDYNRFYTIDVSSPTSPILVGYLSLPEDANSQGIAAAGGYVYVVGGDPSRLTIIQPGFPVITQSGLYATPGYAAGVVVDGSYAYVAGSFEVLDVSDPSEPTQVGSCATRGSAYSLAVTDISTSTYAFLPEGSYGMTVVDATNPTAPTSLGTFPTRGSARDVALTQIDGKTVEIVAEGERGMTAYDVSNPGAPVRLGCYYTRGEAYGVSVNGSTVYLSDTSGALRAIDLSNPSRPRQLGYCRLSVQPYDVFLSGSYAYVPVGYGLVIIDVSDPAHPKQAGYYYANAYIGGLYVTGNLAYLAVYSSYGQSSQHVPGGYGDSLPSNGLEVLDVSDPTSPIKVGYFNSLPGYGLGVFASGSLAYLAMADGGLLVLKYTAPDTGSLKVTLEPQGAIDAGAKWSVDGGAWRDSGATVTGLPLGEHTVSFKYVEGWNAPQSQTVTITKDNVTEVTGTYTGQSGSLTVYIYPEGAVSAGAKWKVGDGAWNNSGDTVTGLEPGDYEVVFNDVTGWITPEPKSVTIHNEQEAVVYGTYGVPKGSLTVTISPQGAIDAGAKWRVDGGGWKESGARIDELSVGEHTVSFKTVNGWTAPESQVVTITKDELTSTTGAYTAQSGSLIVYIYPEDAVSAGAKWKVGDGAWNNSGDTVTGLKPGVHEVVFNDITDWVTPEPKSVTIHNEQEAVAYGTYEVPTGSLTVEISPQGAIDAGARWRVDEGGWRKSGARIDELSVGEHTVSFKTVNGWTAPESQVVTITKDELTSTTGAYTAQSGSLVVYIYPEGVEASGARWQVGESDWKSSGETVTGLAPGKYTVTFSNVTGWITPKAKTVTIRNDQETVAQGIYTRAKGTLKVTLSPATAVKAGAMWSVDGSSWLRSGQVVTLTTGDHTVTFKIIKGYTAPQDATVTINAGKLTSLPGKYVKKKTGK